MLKVYVIHQWCSTQMTLSIQRNGARRAWTSPHPELKPWHVHACSLVELLGLLVKSRALLDCDKALETQCLPCLGDGSNPSALLAKRRLLLAHDLAVLVLGQGGSCHTTHSFLLGSTEDQYLGHASLCNLAHCLLLHCFMAFMAAMAFIAFIALAIVKEESLVFEGVRSLRHLS